MLKIDDNLKLLLANIKNICNQEILLRILQNQDRLFSRLISRLDTEEWDAQFDAIVCRFQILQKAIEYCSQA